MIGYFSRRPQSLTLGVAVIDLAARRQWRSVDRTGPGHCQEGRGQHGRSTGPSARGKPAAPASTSSSCSP